MTPTSFLKETCLMFPVIWQRFGVMWEDVTYVTYSLIGWDCSLSTWNMMTSSNGNIFRITGPLCGEFTGDPRIPSERPVTRSFDVFFDLRLNKRFSKQSWGGWFQTPSHPLWRHCNEYKIDKCTQIHVVAKFLSVNSGIDVISYMFTLA